MTEQTSKQSVSARDGGVAALARGLELLRCFSQRSNALSNGELAEMTGLAKSTVSRLTQTLVGLGYLRYDQESRRYRVGPGVLALGYAALGNLRMVEIAKPHMQALADATDSLVSLATRDQSEMIYLENCYGTTSVSVRSNAGARLQAAGVRMPIATTSIGRAFLAVAGDAERAELLPALAAWAGEAWPEQLQALERERGRYQQEGYCLSLGEWQRDINAAATPILGPAGDDRLILSISGPAFAMTARQITEELAPRLVALAQHLEKLISQA